MKFNTKYFLLALLTTGTLSQVPVSGKDWIKEFQTECPRINSIPWTGSCVGDYAASVTSYIEDLICIKQKTAGKATEIKTILKSIRLSYMDVICNCDRTKCRNNQADGCQGGKADEVLYWISNNGIVGGNKNGFDISAVNYGNYEPLKINHCLNFYAPECTFKTSTPQSILKCTADQPLDFDPKTHCPSKCNYQKAPIKDQPIENYRYKGLITSPTSSHSLRTTDIDRQPVIGFMDVYEDLFMNSGKDIYVHKTGSHLGLYAVKIVGYGVFNNLKYWKVVLPFGSDVGDNGVVMVLREVNHCSIEDKYAYVSMGNVKDDLKKKTTPS